MIHFTEIYHAFQDKKMILLYYCIDTYNINFEILNSLHQHCMLEADQLLTPSEVNKFCFLFHAKVRFQLSPRTVKTF